MQWSGSLTPASRRRSTGSRSAAGSRTAATSRCRCSAIAPDRRRRRRHDHELQRADVLLRRRAVLPDRRRLQRLRRDRRRQLGCGHPLRAETFPNAARPNNVIAPFWTDLNPSASGGARSASDTVSDGVEHLDHRRLGAVRNFSNATTHTCEIWLRARRTGRQGADHDRASSSRSRTAAAQRRRRATRARASNWGAENRDGTSGKNIALRRRPTARSTPSTLAPPIPGGSRDDPVRRVEQEARHVPVRRHDDVRPDDRARPRSADAHGHSVGAG